MDEFDTFYYSGKKVIIRKGKEFSKNELKSRLHQMNIDLDLSKSSKAYFSNKYDEAIESRANKIKIFDKLKNDTDRMGFITNEIKENKKNFILNNEDIETPVNINKKGKGKNIIIKDEIFDDNQLRYLNDKHNNNYNMFKNNNKSNFINLLSNKIEEDENNYTPHDRYEYNFRDNKYKEVNHEKIRENNYQPKIDRRNRPQNYNYLEKNNINIINEPQMKYDFNKKNFDYSPNQNSNKKREYNYSYKNIDENTIEKEDDLKENYNDRNYRFKNINYKPYSYENKNNLKENERKMKNENNDLSIQVNNNINPNLNKRKRYRNYALEKINEDNYSEEIKIRNDDSNTGNKFNIDLLLYILLLIISSFLIYFILKIVFRVSNTFTEEVSKTMKIISNPKKLLRDLIWGIIKSVLLGIFYEYFCVTLQTAILSFVIYILKQKFEFNKLCKQIIEDIKKDLENRMDKSMSENDIVDIYSKKYNIDKNVFIKRYLKALYELRKKDHSLKLSLNINNKGEKEYIWELRH